ncbi:MAG: carbohydrate binding domain-containing protein [Firmicutes bacterium]|nr:carbohydrate binding domain-containing protein [Bacillota bacterium]
MKIRTSVKRLISAVLAGVFLVPAVPGKVFEVNAASMVTVNTDKTYQKIDGFGGINLPEWISEGDMTAAQVQKAFGNGSDELGLTILRIYVSDNSNDWQRAVPTAKRAQALGAKVFATPWNPPSSIRKNGSGTLTTGKYQLRSDKWADYAKHLNNYVKYMEGQGINLYSVSIQNEPDYASEWTYWSADDLAKFAAQYGKTITSGTKAKLMSPESFQYQKTIYNTILNNSTAKNNIDVWGTHFYGTPRSWMDFPALENSGKPIWMTEVYVPNSNSNSADNWPEALQVSENMHNGLVVGNLSAYVWWYIRRSYSLLKENGQISKRGYCFAQYSKFVRPGDYRVDATEQPASNVYVSAYKNSKNQVAIVAVNNSDNGYSQQFSLNGKTITDVDRWRTSKNENLANQNNLANDGKTFWAQLPARSVTTFVVTLGGSSSSSSNNKNNNNNNNNSSSSSSGTQPNSYGWYFDSTFESGTDSWSGRGAASVSSSSSQKYVGSKSLAVTGRTATWNGASKSLDTATYVPGNKYSFSANVKYTSGNSTEPFYLKLQYDASGSTHYATIAEATVTKGNWTQLANKSFTIPSGASNMQLYVETGSTKCDFYMDEVIVAKDGTSISGAGSGSSSSSSNNNSSNTNTGSTNSGTTTSKSWNFSDSQFNGLRTLTSNVTIDGITIFANSSKTVSVPSSPQTLNGTTYKYCLALGGGGSTSYRAVKVPVSGSTVLKVTAKSTGSDTRTLVFVNDSGQQVGSMDVNGTLATGQVTINGNGNIYIYSTRNGINIYKIQRDSTN